MGMLFYSFSLKAKGVDQVIIAQPPATILETCAKAEYSQAWETVKAYFSLENSAKDSHGHYNQVKCNVCPLVSIVFDMSSTSPSLMNEKWDRESFNPTLFFSNSWWIYLKTDRGYWWVSFCFYNSSYILLLNKYFSKNYSVINFVFSIIPLALQNSFWHHQILLVRRSNILLSSLLCIT